MRSIAALLRILRDRVRALLYHDAVADEIAEEIQFHLSERAAEHERRGLAPNAARLSASRQFGNPSIVHDRGYDVRGAGIMESLRQDVRYAVRLLWSQRGFTAIALLTLALGTGATTALFCVIDAALIRPLPYPKPEQLVRISLSRLSNPERRPAPSLADMEDWQSLTDVFSHLGTVRSETRALLEGEVPERVILNFATRDYLPMYGRVPFIGRSITSADERPEAPPIVILGYRFWQSHFHGDTGIVGRALRFDDGPRMVVGILPDDHAQTQPAVWSALQPAAFARTARQYAIWGRLRDGVTFDRGQQELSALAARLEKERPDNKGLGARMTLEYDNVTRWSRSTITVLLGAVGFVLLIGCVNVGSLQLARGAARQTELAIRASIGAACGRLIRQLLIESLVLSIAGSAMGAALAWLALDTIVANIPIAISSDVQVNLNSAVLTASITIAVLVGILCGLAPALKLSRTDLTTMLNRGSRSARAAISRTASRVLIFVEVAAAVLLAAGAALMIASFVRLTEVDLGFDPRGFVTLEVQPVDSDAAIYAAYYPALLERLRTLPGVAAAGATPQLPLGGSRTFSSVSTGESHLDKDIGISVQQILPGYFEALSIPLKSGRYVQESDGSGAWAVLSERAATGLFPHAQAVGQRVLYQKTWLDVIGVVGDTWPQGPEYPPEYPQLYTAYQANANVSLNGHVTGQPMVVVVRPVPGAAIAPAALVDAAHRAGPQALVRRVRNGAEWWDQSEVTPRQRTVLLSILGGLGLALSLVGIFSVTSFSVTRRIPEIGVRMAFGASPGQVVRAIVAEASIPIAAGVTLGLALAYGLTHVIAAFLFRTTPHDPVAFAAVAVTLLLGGATAAWIPARRAARIDPVLALRAE